MEVLIHWLNQTQKSLLLNVTKPDQEKTNVEGNIIFHTDLYNKDSVPLNYLNAKFFVIMSYSEDNVHEREY